VTALAAIGSFIYYYFRCKKEFGGITGDTAGYFILISEGSMVVVSAVLSLL
jgi:adenosylcobinamide-GDP ribazoletransferase